MPDGVLWLHPGTPISSVSPLLPLQDPAPASHRMLLSYQMNLIEAGEVQLPTPAVLCLYNTTWLSVRNADIPQPRMEFTSFSLSSCFIPSVTYIPDVPNAYWT